MNKKILIIIMIIALFAINVCAAANETAVKPNEFPVLTYENYTDPDLQSIENLTKYESGVYLTTSGEIEDFHESYVFMYDDDIIYEKTPNGKVRELGVLFEGPETCEDEDYVDYFFDTWFNKKYPEPAGYFETVLGNL